MVMKTKVALVILFLFVFSSKVSEASASGSRRPFHFYGPSPYECGDSSSEGSSLPAYMPHEFGRRAEGQTRTPPTSAPSRLPEIEVADAFLPYEYVRARFSVDASPPAPRDYPGIAGSGEFMPYEYARRRFAD